MTRCFQRYIFLNFSISASEEENLQSDHKYCRKRHYDHTYCKDEPLPSDNTTSSIFKRPHGVELELNIINFIMDSGRQKETNTTDNTTSSILKRPHGVELELNTNVIMDSGRQKATNTADDSFVNNIEFDDMAISPLPSPHRESSQTSITLVPNAGEKFNGDFGVEMNLKTKADELDNELVWKLMNADSIGGNFEEQLEVGLKPSTPANSNKLALIPKNSDNEDHLSGVFSNMETPQPPVISVARYSIKKTKKGPSIKPMNNKIRNRIVHKYSSLPPCCKIIYDKCKATIDKLRNQLQVAIQSAAAKRAKNSFEYVTSKMPLVVRTFVRMQADMIKNKKAKGRRFKEEYKLLCLSLYTANPAAYNFMSNIFTLPRRTTLMNDANKKLSQKDLATTQIPEREPDVPSIDDSEISDAIAAIAPSDSPAPATPAQSDPSTTTVNPVHADLVAELKKFLPASPKLPKAGAMIKDKRGRFVRRTVKSGAKPTSTRGKTLVKKGTTIRIFQLAEGTTCEDVASHVSEIVPHYLVKCRKVVTKLKGPTFILNVPKEYEESVVDPSFWPEGVVRCTRGTGMSLPDTMLAIRISNVAEGTLASDVVRHVCQVVPEERIICEKVNSVGRGETFKIAMPRMYLKIVAAQSFWPDGVRVIIMRTQKNPRKKCRKRENETDLDLFERQASKRMKHGGKFRPSVYPYS